jgi:hypothetical protein
MQRPTYIDSATVIGHDDLSPTTIKSMSILELQSALKSSAWAPETCGDVLDSVCEMSSSWGTHATGCIFPECGSGYHEWQIVSSLCEAGHPIQKVVLMDAYTDSDWIVHWKALAQLHSVNLTTLDSYNSLNALEKVGKHLVLYVNGTLRFGSRFPLKSKEAAIDFWNWCHDGAANKPVNFVRGKPVLPGGCSDWSLLAEAHSSSIGEP